MKKIYYAIILFYFFVNISKAQVPVFLYIGSHNETTDQQYHGLDYSNAADYATIKTYIQSVADTVIYYNARWDMMLESNFILGCLQNDSAYTNTNDIIEWAYNTPEIDVQPHNHFKPTGTGANPYNYADLCYLLDSCGLIDTPQVMGGFIWKNFTSPTIVNEDWTQWQTPQPGYTFPFYFWKPTLLWGGGSPGHINDYEGYGIWKPKAATQAQFGMHDTSKSLINFGTGCGEDFVLWDTTDVTLLAYRIMNFADSVNTHFASTPNAFFNMKVMTNFRYFTATGFAAKVGQLIRIIQPYINNGKIQWKGIMEQYAWWQQQHPNPTDYFSVTCANTVIISNTTPSIYLGVDEINDDENNFSVYPNPFTEEFTVDGLQFIQRDSYGTVKSNHELKVFDVFGREILSQQITTVNCKLKTVNWSSGVYFIKAGNRTQKIIKQ